MTEQEKIKKLCSLAESALSVKDEDSIESFIERTESYLLAFESWQSELQDNNPLADTSSLNEQQKEEFRGLLGPLNELHQQLMDRAGISKDKVGSEMGQMHHRAKGLRKYIDRYPSRITIAGKRKG